MLKDSLPGKTVGEYRILSPLGEGGMGVVYAAVNIRIEKKVAIKVLKGKGVEQDRLIAEAIAVNQVGHRNVVSIFGTGVLPDGRRYIVMEYLEGEPLDAYLRRKGTLTPFEVCELLQDVCSPLGAAHGQGIVHRDLKPANVFLVKQADDVPFVKVLDFGLARQNTATRAYDEKQTRDLVLEGTPEYMSPEQCTAQPVGAWTDLYAVGTIAYEMLTGAPPFRMEGAAAIEIMTAKVRHPAPRLPPEVPEPLAALVAQLLAIKPLDRPSSAEATRNQLRRIGRMLQEGGAEAPVTTAHSRPAEPAVSVTATPVTEAPTSATPAPRRRPHRSRNSKPLMVVAAGIFLLLGIGIVMLVTRKPRTRPVPQPVPAVVVKPDPTPLQPQDPVVPPVEPEVVEDEVADAGAPVVEAPRVRRPPPPSLDDLKQRLGSMEARYRKTKNPEPEAKVALSSFRVRITVVSSPADRTELMRDFAAWEKKFAR